MGTGTYTHSLTAIGLGQINTGELIKSREALEQIWRTPQSQQQLVAHSTPVLYDLVEERAL